MAAVAASSADHHILVGNVPTQDEASLRRRAADLGLSHRVSFTGFLDERALSETFDEAEIVVRARRPDVGGNPLAVSGPIVQAMAAGCAVVTTDARGSAACLADGGGVDLSERPGSLQAVLARLLSDPGETARLGEAARAHIERYHRPEVVGRQLQELWG